MKLTVFLIGPEMHFHVKKSDFEIVKLFMS